MSSVSSTIESTRPLPRVRELLQCDTTTQLACQRVLLELEILALVESLLYTKVSKSGTLPNWDDSGASTNPPFSATETREVESLLTGLLDSGSPSEVQWVGHPFALIFFNEKSTNTEQQANIIKGWVDWLTGQFHSSLDRLKGLQESPKASSIGNYRALRIMKTVVMGVSCFFLYCENVTDTRVCITAWSLESLDRKSESSTLLDTTFSQSNGFLNVASSPTPRKLDTLESQWTEQYLFVWARLASLGSAKGSSQKLLEMYTSYTGLLAPDVLTTRRIRIYRNLFEAELPVFKSGSEDVYLTPLLMRPNQSQEVSTLRSHLPRYQSLLRQLVDLSKGVGTTDLDRARSQRLLESYDWLFTCQSSVSENETPEMAIQRHLKLIEVGIPFFGVWKVQKLTKWMHLHRSFMKELNTFSCLSNSSGTLGLHLHPCSVLWTIASQMSIGW